MDSVGDNFEENQYLCDKGAVKEEPSDNFAWISKEKKTSRKHAGKRTFTRISGERVNWLECMIDAN